MQTAIIGKYQSSRGVTLIFDMVVSYFVANFCSSQKLCHTHKKLFSIKNGIQWCIIQRLWEKAVKVRYIAEKKTIAPHFVIRYIFRAPVGHKLMHSGISASKHGIVTKFSVIDISTKLSSKNEILLDHMTVSMVLVIP